MSTSSRSRTSESSQPLIGRDDPDGADKPTLLNTLLAKSSIALVFAASLSLSKVYVKIESAQDKAISTEEHMVAKFLLNIPFSVFTASTSSIGLIGVLVLWMRNHAHYDWLIYNLFYPGLTHSLMATLYAAINVYTENQASITSKIAVIISPIAAFASLTLIAIYYTKSKVQVGHMDRKGSV